MTTAMFGCFWLFCLLHITFYVQVEGSSSHCIFGPRESGCLYPCHCHDSSEKCNQTTGECESGCMYTEGISDEKFYPWFNPGCQLGNMLLGQRLNLRHKETGAVLKSVTINPPYGSPSPDIYLQSSDPVSIDELELRMELGQTSFIKMLTLSSYHDTTAFFMSIRQRNCRIHAKVADDDLINFSDCSFKLTAPKEPIAAICNAVGKYLLLTATDCDLKASNIIGLKVNQITIFGNPYMNISCEKCLKNNSTVATEQSILYARSVYKEHINEQDIETLSGDWNCGNGIWCEECIAGYYPPDCKKACDRGYYDMNCMHSCRDIDVPREYHCKGGQSDLCDPTTGEITKCSKGCDTWYGGSDGLCKLYIGNVSWNGYELTAERVGSDWVSMRFNTPGTINPELASFYRYYIEYREAGKAEWTVHPSVAGGITHEAKQCQLSVEVSDLKKDTVYNFRMRLSREHQGHKLLEALDYNSFSTVITSCLKPPAVQCQSRTCRLSWNLNQTSHQCESMAVTKLLHQMKGDEDWKSIEIETGKDGWEISDLPAGTFRAKLLGSIGDSGNIEVESDAVSSDIIDLFADFTTWHPNYVTVVAIGVMLIITIITGKCCYGCGKKRNCRMSNLGSGRKVDYLKDHYELAASQPASHEYVLPPQPATDGKPTVGTGTRTFRKKHMSFIGTIGDNTEDMSSAEYLNPASSAVDNELYCQLNIQDEA